LQKLLLEKYPTLQARLGSCKRTLWFEQASLLNRNSLIFGNKKSIFSQIIRDTELISNFKSLKKTLRFNAKHGLHNTCRQALEIFLTFAGSGFDLLAMK
jgi:hypothetical protein